MKYVTDARNAMATPILFSPVARRGYLAGSGKSGTPTLADPGFNGLDQQARDLAAAEKIAFVDLTTLALKYYGTVDPSPLFYRSGRDHPLQCRGRHRHLEVGGRRFEGGHYAHDVDWRLPEVESAVRPHL